MKIRTSTSFYLLVILCLFSSCTKEKTEHDKYGVTEITTGNPIFLYQKQSVFAKHFGPAENYLWDNYSDPDDVNILLDEKGKILYLSVAKNGLDNFKIRGTDKPLSKLTVSDLQLISDPDALKSDKTDTIGEIEIYKNYYGYYQQAEFSKDGTMVKSLFDNVYAREFLFENGKLFFFRIGSVLLLVDDFLSD